MTALMLLVPPATALQAWLLFGETLSAVQLAGFAVALAGVMIVQGIHRPGWREQPTSNVSLTETLRAPPSLPPSRNIGQPLVAARSVQPASIGSR